MQYNYNYITGTCTSASNLPKVTKALIFNYYFLSLCCLCVPSAEYIGSFQHEINLLMKINHSLLSSQNMVLLCYS